MARSTKSRAYMKFLLLLLNVDDLKSLEFAIVENVQRNDLNAIEEARGYQRLIEEFSYDQEKVCYNLLAKVEVTYSQFFKIIKSYQRAVIKVS